MKSVLSLLSGLGGGEERESDRERESDSCRLKEGRGGRRRG
jgi:hypothetical protein